MLTVQNLHVGYGVFEVLFGIELVVQKGAWVSIVGTNGSGKTTLMNALMGINLPTHGLVQWKDLDITYHKPFERCRLGMGYLAEGRQLFPHLTVHENLELGAIAARLPKIPRQKKIQEVYQRFPHLFQRRKQKAGTLSGGEQQILALARCLIADPEILLCDELSLGLSPAAVKDFFKVLQDLHNKGTTILMVEQNVELALQLCTYGYVLDQGQVTLSGTGKELLKNPQVQEVYLGFSTNDN